MNRFVCVQNQQFDSRWDEGHASSVGQHLSARPHLDSSYVRLEQLCLRRCELEYVERTSRGRLRHAVFRRLIG